MGSGKNEERRKVNGRRVAELIKEEAWASGRAAAGPARPGPARDLNGPGLVFRLRLVASTFDSSTLHSSVFPAFASPPLSLRSTRPQPVRSSAPPDQRPPLGHPPPSPFYQIGTAYILAASSYTQNSNAPQPILLSLSAAELHASTRAVQPQASRSSLSRKDAFDSISGAASSYLTKLVGQIEFVDDMNLNHDEDKQGPARPSPAR
ncbi:hypothetical protein EJ110_NYTH54603 [Nymphaea thermarum]|nr:hypothetical protein EJ110_NYTH54603 [Nymphaea thermarum]